MRSVRKRLVIADTETIRKKVLEHLRERILNGEIGPNERLVETKIAEEIGTSRTPVREALHTLEQEGLIESIPRIGYKAKLMSDQEAVEIWEIRSVIETLAARWACENARERLIKELKKNIILAEKHVTHDKVAKFVDLDAQFHEVIARLSGGKRLLELTQSLRRHALRYRIQSIYLPGTALRAIDGHKKILEAIEGNNQQALTKAIQDHLEQSKTDTLRYAFSGEEKGKGKDDI
jgi:GntR family transcriptional regulator, rspAB operon transcriptional repressor